MMDKSTNKIEETSGSTQPSPLKPYVKPVLSKLGSLRDMTMSKNTSGKTDNQGYKRFTGRGGHRIDGSGL